MPTMSTRSKLTVPESSFLCQTPIIWKNVAMMSVLHLASLMVIVRAIQGSVSLHSISFNWMYAFGNGFGILAGAHRLWSHKSYKARLPLRILLMVMQTASLQNNLYDWCRNHRAHHRFSETDADPHNSNRGFFFSHIGWLLCRKHPDVKHYGKYVNMDDILDDPVVRFQMKYFKWLVFLFWFLVPVSCTMVFFNETLISSFMVNCFRYVVSLHNTWLVNSLAHLNGNRPYNRLIKPRENKIVAYFSMGEGYHNYHHTFPCDYSASELGWKHNYNFATAFIDLFAWLGLAYNLRCPSLSSVINKIEQTGDQSIKAYHYKNRQINGKTFNWLDSFLGLLIITWPIWLIAVLKWTFNAMWTIE